MFKKKQTDTSRDLVPVRDRAHLPVPQLPSSSGAGWGTRWRILRHDTAYVKQHADYLNARVAQGNAMRQLVDTRIDVAVSMSKLASIGEITATEYLKGRRQRASELRLLHVQCETAEVNAELALVAARRELASIAPPPDVASAAAGLSPAEVEELLRVIPEINPETARTLSHLLAGRLKERTGE